VILPPGSAGLYPSCTNPSKRLLGDDNQRSPEVAEAALRKNPAVTAELIDAFEGKPSDGTSAWWRRGLTTLHGIAKQRACFDPMIHGLSAKRPQSLNVFLAYPIP
jgi:hypothetical protein